MTSAKRQAQFEKAGVTINDRADMRREGDGIRRRVITSHALHQEPYTRGRKNHRRI